MRKNGRRGTRFGDRNLQGERAGGSEPLKRQGKGEGKMIRYIDGLEILRGGGEREAKGYRPEWQRERKRN